MFVPDTNPRALDLGIGQAHFAMTVIVVFCSMHTHLFLVVLNHYYYESQLGARLQIGRLLIVGLPWIQG